MATWNTAAADALLKTVFQDPLFDGVVTHSRVIDLFEQNSNVKEGPQGKYIELAHMFGYNEGIGSRSEDGFLPVPGNPTFVNGRVNLKKTLAVAQMTRNIMANAVKSKAAFADWAEVELTKTERALRADLDRQAIGYGAGILCRIDDASRLQYQRLAPRYPPRNAFGSWAECRWVRAPVQWHVPPRPIGQQGWQLGWGNDHARCRPQCRRVGTE
jgi:hypothetical protein